MIIAPGPNPNRCSIACDIKRLYFLVGKKLFVAPQLSLVKTRLTRDQFSCTQFSITAAVGNDKRTLNQ